MRRLVLTVVCFLAIPCASVWAQTRVGIVTEIKGVKVLPPCPPEPDTGPPENAVLITHRDKTVSFGPTAGSRQDTMRVLLHDSIHVKRSSDARLLIDSRYGSGVFVLTPDFGRCKERRGRDVKAGIVDDGATRGIYRIDSVTGNKGVMVSVLLGALTVDWAKGSLWVWALGQPMQVNGTQFAVAVDSTLPRAYLYVKAGRVEFEAVPGLAATSQQMYTWTPDSLPRLISPLPAQVERDFLFHAKDIWIRVPTELKVGGGIVASLGVVYLLTHRDPTPNPGPGNGTITVRLPL
jgi:hypothetical protein